MDSSELLPLAGALLFAVLCVYTWFQARAISGKALRLSLRIGAAFVATAAIFFAAALLIVGIGYTRHLPPVVSPDGKHLALTAYTVNSGTASDIAEVSVRSAWTPYSYRVYVGPGQFQPMAATQSRRSLGPIPLTSPSTSIATPLPTTPTVSRAAPRKPMASPSPAKRPAYERASNQSRPAE